MIKYKIWCNGFGSSTHETLEQVLEWMRLNNVDYSFVQEIESDKTFELWIPSQTQA